ncbi:MAG: hypothetical protein KDK70_15860, partial [Myxococcales bacterium]|nr:hypothetical protein [Myxococcales bacterium]
MTTKAAKSNFRTQRLVVGAMTLSTLGLGASGCIEDSDCGICDPDSLVLEHITGVNYASRKVHVLNPECEGPSCPGAVSSSSYFIQNVRPCEETDEALESPRGPEEYCKISPLVTAYGIEFIFNNLLDPTSIELVRKRPDNPQLFEVYDWKHQVVEIEGPITRYNGDFKKGATEEPDLMARLVNLSCIDNLSDEGIPFDHTSYEDPATNPCNALGPNGLPRKMRSNSTLTSYPGRWSAGGVDANVCSAPDEGPDTCCSWCDYLLSTKVAKYGVNTPPTEGITLTELQQSGQLRNANQGFVLPEDVAGDTSNAAILCNPDGDVFQQCAGFIPWTDRSEQVIEYTYYWDCNPATDAGCEPKTYGLPYYDKLRETHPDQRPSWLERRNAACTDSFQCRDENQHDLPGTDCVGITADGLACNPAVDPEGCTNGRCVAEWFVTCATNPDTSGDADPTTPEIEGFCTDQRFYDRGAGACLRTQGPFDALCGEDGTDCQTAPSGTRLAFCDHNEDGTLVASECCQATLQEGQASASPEACDPAYQNVTPLTIYDRNDTLPEPTRSCICPPGGTLGDLDPEDSCFDTIKVGCFLASDVRDNGDAAVVRPDRASRYAVKFVSREGGVIYDPAIKGFEWRTADVGGVPRASIESCAESRDRIDRRNIEDGWRANDAFNPDRVEDFDRSMCSDSEYTVHFRTPEDGGQYVKDKVGNTLAGKSTYTFRTPQFHVEP